MKTIKQKLKLHVYAVQAQNWEKPGYPKEWFLRAHPYKLTESDDCISLGEQEVFVMAPDLTTTDFREKQIAAVEAQIAAKRAELQKELTELQTKLNNLLALES